MSKNYLLDRFWGSLIAVILLKVEERTKNGPYVDICDMNLKYGDIVHFKK